MQEEFSDPFRPEIGFDPVCGSILEGAKTNPFFDGEKIYYFCCLACRRSFVEARRSRRPARPRGGESNPFDLALSI